MTDQYEQQLARLSSIRDMVIWGAQQFEAAQLGYTHGMPNAIDEAVFLCLSALALPHDLAEQHFDSVLTARQKRKVLEYYKQRLQFVPASYITNTAWFAGLEFYVDARVLIPRSPFAELIAERFVPWVRPHKVNHVLDLCTGSACIAIACAYAFEHAQIIGADISADALDVAHINRDKHHLQQRVQLVQSDLFSSVPEQQFDLIVSNPPYVSQQEMQELNNEFEHEPALGLVAGEQGLDIVIPLLRQARQYLADDGVVVIEVGYTWAVLQQALPTVPFMWLEFEHGGEGVFTLTAQQLDEYQAVFDQFPL